MDLTGIYIGLGVTLIINVAMIAFSYGKITSSVTNVCKDLGEHKKAYSKHLDSCHQDMASMGTRVNDVCREVGEIRGEMKGFNAKPTNVEVRE